MFPSTSSKLLLLVSLITVWTVEATPRRHPFTTNPSKNALQDVRIIGGEENHNGPVPFMVSVMLFGQHYCGGSIINKRTIVTAAHCLKFNVKDYRIHAGDNTLEVLKGEILKIKAKHVHPEFDVAIYDIGILRLEKSLRFNKRIKPIALVGANTKLKYGEIATVYGWGHTKFEGENSEVLKLAHVPLFERGVCEIYMGRLTESELCAGVLAGGVDACQSDSGGPLIQDDRLIGVVSWGDQCALPDRLGVYADVQFLLPWLKETLYREYGEKI